MRAKTLAATSAAVTATAVVGGLASRPDTTWYSALRKPPFQPPPIAFPIAWTTLYAMIAAASAEAIDSLDAEERQQFEAALAVNLVLNAGWTWAFFRFQRPVLATVEAAALAASTADLARRARAGSTPAFRVLVPYAGWTAFATVLSGSIAWLNRGSARRRRR